MLIHALTFIGGLAALVAGAELLVRGASKLALSLGISPLVVGLTVVAFGTSAPEMAVSTDAALSGKADIAIGNAVGSNIFNVLFILGLSAVITPLSVHLQVIRQEAPIMVGGALLLLVLSLDGQIDLFDAVLLMSLLLAYTAFLVRQSHAETRSGHDHAGGLQAAATPDPDRRWLQILLIAAGLALLVVGSQLLVTAAVAFAKALGIGDVVIGLTIVAAGTSMPEVAASVMAALKGERDIAVGNVVGSCIFNMFGVIGLAGLSMAASGSGALPVPEAVRQFDLWVMAAALGACIPVFLSGREIARWEGALFLLYYAAYTTYLIMAAQRHAGLSAFSDVMAGFVVPLTVVTLVASLLRRKS